MAVLSPPPPATQSGCSRRTSRVQCQDEQQCAGSGAGAGDRAPVEHLDVVVIGAGLSGIGAAISLQRDFPGRSLAILDEGNSIGGTWHTFSYVYYATCRLSSRLSKPLQHLHV